MRVSRKKATYQSGPKKGGLKPGCRFIKGDGADCGGTKSATKTRKKTSKKKKSKSKSKHPCSRPNPPAWCNKGKKKTSGKKRRSSGPKRALPEGMVRLQEWRRAFNASSTCPQAREALRNLKQQFKYLASKPATKKRGESQDAANTRRWNRWVSEYNNKLRTTEGICLGLTRSQMSGLGKASGKSKKHPCARPNPPAWCNR
ncbi:MAG TPA: hypothetical protein PKD27_02465 [Tepidiformaceae bacterium]|nr:hypothetical protein [Tepidiformaceae bacterium]